MNFNILNLAKMFVVLIVVFTLLLADQEGAEARKKNKKRSGSKRKLNRTKENKNKRHRRRHSLRDDDITDDKEADKIAAMMTLLRKEKEARKSRKIVKSSHKVTEWTDASMNIGSEFQNKILKVKHSATGKFGYHIKPHNVFGKVVHILDTNREHHYGCSDVTIIDEIPRNEPWIALIKRGKCYFFNKISLGEKYNASAVVIYDDKDGNIQVMNTAGTKVVSLMINLQDGNKIAKLVDSGVKVYANITVGKYHTAHEQTPPPIGKSQQLSSTEADVTNLGGGSGRHLFSPFLCIFVLASYLFVHNS